MNNCIHTGGVMFDSVETSGFERPTWFKFYDQVLVENIQKRLKAETQIFNVKTQDHK